VRSWSRKKKAAFEQHASQVIAGIGIIFHGKTISPFAESTIKGPSAG
jgi:hypothetical protein